MSTTMAEWSQADPRPRAQHRETGVVIGGWRCGECGHPVTQFVLACPVCRGAVAEAAFATEGEVWAATCLRVRVPGHEPPFAMAYLVLDDGPRVLVHTAGGEPLVPGSRARVADVTDDGDLVAQPLEEVAR